MVLRSLCRVSATSNEEAAAKVAAANADSGAPTMFCPSHIKTGLISLSISGHSFQFRICYLTVKF